MGEKIKNLVNFIIVYYNEEKKDEDVQEDICVLGTIPLVGDIIYFANYSDMEYSRNADKFLEKLEEKYNTLCFTVISRKCRIYPEHTEYANDDKWTLKISPYYEEE